MRMRKKKNGEARLLACAELLAKAPAPTDRPLWLEIGAGKGGFAIEMAKRNPEVDYYAMEKVSDCVTLAVEALKRSIDECGAPKNLHFIVNTADNLSLLVGEGTVDAIFLNFSDPWTKKGYAKRRLTHARYLSLYMSLLKDGGRLRFKTDNVELFDFTLTQLDELGLTPVKLTRDLHTSEWNGENVRTEYEINFSEKGFPINMVEVERPEGFAIPVPHDLTEEGRLENLRKYKKYEE